MFTRKVFEKAAKVAQSDAAAKSCAAVMTLGTLYAGSRSPTKPPKDNSTAGQEQGNGKNISKP